MFNRQPSPVDVDLRLGGEMRGGHARAELLTEERDQLVAAREVERAAVHGRAVVRGGVGGEGVREAVPVLGVDTAEVAVLETLDLFQRD
jgi:hypothetical protein